MSDNVTCDSQMAYVAVNEVRMTQSRHLHEAEVLGLIKCHLDSTEKFLGLLLSLVELRDPG